MIRIGKYVAFVLALACLAGEVFAQQTATVSFGQPGGAAAAVDFGGADGAKGSAGIEKPKKKKKSKDTELDAAAKPASNKVNADVALKQTPTKAVDLPGVLNTKGESPDALDFSRSRVVQIDNGGSKTIWLSDHDQNRVQLPWANAKVIGTDEIDIDKRKTSNNVYIMFKAGVSRAVQVYFEDPLSNVVLGAQLVPKDIPAQTIIVRDMTQGGRPVVNKANSYISEIQARMETVAMGGAPSGYSEMDANIPAIVMNGLVITTQKIYSSASNEIFVYDVANPGPLSAMLSEKEFDGPNVLAVSIFPKPLLNAKEHARVIVEASRKEQLP